MSYHYKEQNLALKMIYLYFIENLGSCKISIFYAVDNVCRINGTIIKSDSVQLT